MAHKLRFPIKIPNTNAHELNYVHTSGYSFPNSTENPPGIVASLGGRGSTIEESTNHSAQAPRNYSRFARAHGKWYGCGEFCVRDVSGLGWDWRRDKGEEAMTSHGIFWTKWHVACAKWIGVEWNGFGVGLPWGVKKWIET